MINNYNISVHCGSSLPALPEDPLELRVRVLVGLPVGGLAVLVLGVLDQGQGLEVHGAALEDERSTGGQWRLNTGIF